MKRLLLLCLLLFSNSFAVGFADRLFMSDEEIARAERIEAEKAKRTKHFFGIEGGAGLIDLYLRYNFFTTNPLFIGENAPLWVIVLQSMVAFNAMIMKK